MRRAFLVCLSALIAGSAVAQPTRRSLKIPAREVVADARMPLPAAGKVYLFTSKALTRAQVEGAVGLRYLGLLGPNVYSFARVGGE